MSEKRSPLDIMIDKACVREPEPPLDVKPCPFCGGEVIGKVEIDHPKVKVMLMCMSDSTCTGNMWGKSLEEAMKFWNCRA